MRTCVIIGNSAAGLSAIESIRQVDKLSKIINISREPHRPYSRCLLSYYLAGVINKDRLWIRPEDYYKNYNVETFLGTAVTKIDAKNKTVQISANNKEQSINYDKLLLATGADPKAVDVAGRGKKGVFTLRTLNDADAMLAMMDEVKDVAILGGGLIGLRAAYSLRKRSKNVQVFVTSSHIFSQMLDPEAADMLRRHLENNGIKILTGTSAKEITGPHTGAGKTGISGVVLDDKREFPAQLVIMGKGVGSNTSLVKDYVKTEYGVLVDEHLASTNSDIYAAGDVAQTYDLLEEKNNVNAIWPAAIRQGKIAGLNMAGPLSGAGKAAVYEGSCGMNSVDFFGLSALSFGIVKPKKDSGYEELIAAEFKNNIYRKVVLKNNRIVGAILINDVEKHGILLHLALQKIDVSDIKDLLVDEYFDYAKIIPIVKRQSESFKGLEYKDTVQAYTEGLSIDEIIKAEGVKCPS